MYSIFEIEFIHKVMYEAKCRKTSAENIMGTGEELYGNSVMERNIRSLCFSS